MNTLDIPDEYRDRIEALRVELADNHAGPYATVETDDVLAYLLDLAEAVDDPGREADPEAFEDDTATSPEPFDHETVREQLADRNRKHADPDETDRMDLYTIAAEFDVAGRSGMTKDELVAAILDRAAALAGDPFAAVGIDVDAAGDDRTKKGDAGADDTSEVDEPSEVDGPAEPDDAEAESGEQDGTDEETDGADGSDSSQLNAMMSLLDTHDDKWREGDGDVRYEVDLPDGSVETARTKDDVRALLFRNY